MPGSCARGARVKDESRRPIDLIESGTGVVAKMIGRGRRAMVKRQALKAIPALLGLLLLAGLGTAEARGHTHVFLGFGFGAPAYPYYYPPYVYPPPVIYAPPPVYVPPPVIYTPPPVYQPQASPQSWYYCDNPQGYYPYVTTCNSGWRQVPATPPQ
jgi:hypothetical protein